LSFHKAVLSHKQAKVVVKFNGLLLLLLLTVHHSTITTEKGEGKLLPKRGHEDPDGE